MKKMTLYLNEELFQRIENDRGNIPRSKWLRTVKLPDRIPWI